MATAIGTYYGTAVGASTVRFRAVGMMQYTSTDAAKGYYVQKRYYIEVIVGQPTAFTNHCTVSWNSGEYTLSKEGIYADTGWVDAGWIPPGQTVSISGSAQYTSSSSGLKKSTCSGSFAVPNPKTYTVSYNANGGSGAPGSQTKTEGVTLTLSSTRPTRTGYTFVRWNTNASGTGTNYNAGASYTANAAVALYAVWTAATYTITFAGNGATSGVPSSINRVYGQNVTFPSGTPVRSGYTFGGWLWYGTGSNPSATSTAISGSYMPGQTAYASASSSNICWDTSNCTYVATWRINTYTVSYNANTSGASGTPTSQTKTYNQTLTLSSQTPSKDGLRFLRWNTNSAGTGTNYPPGASYTENNSLTLYAIWEEVAEVFIKVNGVYVKGIAYVKKDGVYSTGKLSVKRNGAYTT